MTSLTLPTIVVVLLSLATQGYCAVVARVDNVSPTPNTTIAELVGPASLHFNCDIYEDRSGNDTRVTTAWFLRFPSNPENLFVIQSAATHPDFNISGTAREGGPFPTFRNSLTLINMTSALDEVWLICGHSAQGVNDLARWRLRAYYPPQLSNGRVIKVDERDGNIPVDIATPPLAYPTPTGFQWTKDGVTIPTSSRATFSYPSVLFNSLERSDSGLYSLTATNHRTDNGVAIGTGQGSFTLDVLYGPDIVPSTQIYSAVVGDSITLVCGTSLESNPMATIMWLDQLGLPIPNAGRYTFNNGTEEVSLDFSFTRAGDSGVWACVLGVSDPDVMVASGGQLVSRDNKEIGSRTNQITLVIVVPPSEPQVVEVQSQATNATLSWTKPSDAGQPGITAYQITADDGMVTPIMYTSSDNLTEQTITGLLPGREYQFTVRAVSSSGDAMALSNASLPVFANTSTTVPAPRCDSAVSNNGAITITSSLLHTGGLPLSSLTISYTYTEGLNVVQGGQPEMVSSDETSHSFPGLITGFAYTFSVTAVNTEGTAVAVCTPVDHLIGIPMEPKQPTVTAVGPNSVEVTMETNSPGVQEGATFYYDLKYAALQDDSVMGGVEVEVSRGGPITQRVDGLMQGYIYVFSVRTRNTFGESRFVTSEPLNFNGTMAAPSAPIGAIVGGVVGGTVVVIIIILLIVVLLILFAKAREGGSYRVSNKRARNRIDSSAGVKVEEVPLDVGIPLEGAPKELHYADLETFRSPSATPSQKKPTSPTTATEERVEYATIDTFKKHPSQENEVTPDNDRPPPSTV